MSRRVLRWVVVLVAVAALAAAAFKVWELEQEATLERDTAGTFDRQAWQLALGLADLRAAIQAYVADGQISESWQKTAADLYLSVSTQATALRGLARSPEGQGAVESAIEGAAALAKTEARAREFLTSSQRLSASDVVFSEAAPHITKIGNHIDISRGHEMVASATRLRGMRVRQLTYLGASIGLTLVALLLLVSVPRSRGLETEASDSTDAQPGSSLGIGHIPSSHAPALLGGAGERPALTVSLSDTAEVCMALAMVQEPRELPALLERAAAVLHAAGIVVWMPDGPNGTLRPALAHGYPPLTVTRMGTLAVDADNATAVAYRTRTSQLVPADAQGPGAVAVPLVTADGCSGVMAAEITSGVHAESARAAATIIAAQLATLISPIAPAGQRAE